MTGERPPLAVVAGATASGKSAVAVRLAEQLGGVVINADASQLYADLAVVSARPTAAEMGGVPHRLFGVVDGAEACSAAGWAAMAKAAIADAHGERQLPILVGGTGLYLAALLEGMAPVPPVPDAVRAAVRAMPADAVRAALLTEDPAMAARLNPGDPQRNARALEVWRATGRSLIDWQGVRTGGIGAAMAVRAVVLDPPRAVLAARIDARVAAMWAAGALTEVRRLGARELDPALPVMRAIGVPPLLALLGGEMGEADALARWRLDTRRYAKRQGTWFRHQRAEWPRAGDAGAALALLAAGGQAWQAGVGYRGAMP